LDISDFLTCLKDPRIGKKEKRESKWEIINERGWDFFEIRDIDLFSLNKRRPSPLFDPSCNRGNCLMIL
jgi:hypothetical protein